MYLIKKNTNVTAKGSFEGLFLVFIGVVFWSIGPLLVKIANLDSIFICGARSIIAGIALLPALRYREIRWSPWVIIYFFSYMGLCMGLIIALTMTSTVIAIGMQYTSIIWIFLFRTLMTRRVKKIELVSILIIFLGILIFMATGKNGTDTKGLLIVLSEGISFALMSISCKKCGGNNPLGLTSLANIFSGIFIFIFCSPSLSEFKSLNIEQWCLILIMGLIQVGAGYGFYNTGLNKVSTQQASVIALWEMILGPVWVAIFLREYPSLQILGGFIIIIIGIVINIYSDLLSCICKHHHSPVRSNP